MLTTLDAKENKFKLNTMPKAKKPTSKKAKVKKPVAKKEVKGKVIKTKVEKPTIDITHQYVPHVPRRIDTVPPPKKD